MTGKAWIGIILAVVCVSSVGLRHAMSDDTEKTVKQTSTNITTGGASFAPSSSTTIPGTQETLKDDDTDSFFAKSLPFLTEASFFGLIGFALGYFSRKVVKLMMIVIAILFIALQLMQYLEVVAIDWQKLIDVLNGAILNLKENDSISAVLKDKVPTAGALVAGYFLGFRKG